MDTFLNYSTGLSFVVLNCPDCDSALIEFDPGSGIHHCPNSNCTFMYFDKNTGKKYRKTEK